MNVVSLIWPCFSQSTSHPSGKSFIKYLYQGQIYGIWIPGHKALTVQPQSILMILFCLLPTPFWYLIWSWRYPISVARQVGKKIKFEYFDQVLCQAVLDYDEDMVGPMSSQGPWSWSGTTWQQQPGVACLVVPGEQELRVGEKGYRGEEVPGYGPVGTDTLMEE